MMRNAKGAYDVVLETLSDHSIFSKDSLETLSKPSVISLLSTNKYSEYIEARINGRLSLVGE
jgi:hypothetical protein